MGHDDEVVAWLRKELARVGRDDVSVVSGPNGTVTLSATDGSWSGPAPSARIALDRTPDSRGVGGDFWSRFPR